MPAKSTPLRTPTPCELFEYAKRYAARSEARGQGTAYPTIRACARYLRITQAEVESLIDDYSGPGYLGRIVAFSTYGGVGEIKGAANYQVEAYA